MPLKFNIAAGRWVFAWNGVSEAEAAAHGYIPRPAAPPTPLDRNFIRLRAEAKAQATYARKRKIREKAKAKERARVRNKAYQADYYVRVTKPRRAERRALAP
jgi:hypothetical protein